MVLPIISSLASVSSSISLISTGLTGISSIIGGLGSALAGVFSTGLLASVGFYEELKTNTESFLEEFVDLHVTAFGKIRERHEIMTGKLGKQLDKTTDSFLDDFVYIHERAFAGITDALGFGSSETSSDRPGRGQAGGVGTRKPASAYIPGYVAPTSTPTATFNSPRKSFAEMETKHPLAGLNDTLDALRQMIADEEFFNRKAAETNVTVNVHGGAMERRAAMAVGNIIAEEANRKTGTQQRATRYL